jgi:hypothetical protein
VGALNRIGDDALHPLKYRTLVRMLREPDQRRARVLKQVEVISETTLSVLRVLDPTFLYPDIVKRFRSTASVQAFNAAVDLIRRVVPSVTDEDLLASLKALGPTSGLDTWAQRWVTKAEFPLLPPITDDEDWRVLRTGEAMAEAGQRFRNCLKGRVAVVALGRVPLTLSGAPSLQSSNSSPSRDPKGASSTLWTAFTAPEMAEWLQRWSRRSATRPHRRVC